ALLEVAVGPHLLGASSCPLISRKGGCPIEYIRSFSTLPCNHRHLRPVHTGKKEVTAGTLTSTAITSKT
ncbi:hypothetical protein, partial [Ruthenibacterium sp.]|uniref:hypothetical protein n=1 Tax=Ruthenibacterium sp. TaxID=1905345 RepID=UPI00257A250D